MQTGTNWLKSIYQAIRPVCNISFFCSREGQNTKRDTGSDSDSYITSNKIVLVVRLNNHVMLRNQSFGKMYLAILLQLSPQPKYIDSSSKGITEVIQCGIIPQAIFYARSDFFFLLSKLDWL